MAILAQCPKCKATRSYKDNCYEWAKKNALCRSCGNVNCYNFTTDYPYGIEYWFESIVYKWRCDWEVKAFKWNWFKFKWEESK